MHTNKNHESLLILTELTSIFTDEKDAALICSIKEKESLIRARHDAKQAEMKNTIKGTLVLRARLLTGSLIDLFAALTSDVRKIEMKAQRKESKEQFNAKIAALEKEKDLVATNLGQYERNIKKMDEELSRLSLVETNMQAKASTIRREAGDEVPRTKHLLSLYRSISNIQWRHDSDFIEGRTCPHLHAPVPHLTYIFHYIQMSHLWTMCGHSPSIRPSTPRSPWPISSGSSWREPPPLVQSPPPQNTCSTFEIVSIRRFFLVGSFFGLVGRLLPTVTVGGDRSLLLHDLKRRSRHHIRERRQEEASTNPPPPFVIRLVHGGADWKRRR